METILYSTYTNPEASGGFGGVQSLYRSLKGHSKVKDIQQWLQGKDSYTLHKPVRRKFLRNRVYVSGIDNQFQADLVDMQSLSEFNDGYKYLLTCIDVFSKYAWAIPLKDKRAETIVSAFEKIFSERIPRKLQTDAGKEFLNRKLQRYLQKMKIHFFTTNNITKASVVERLNRTLRMKMWKYFTEKNTRNYINIIDKLIHSYNHTWHRTIKTEPVSVNKDNEKSIWSNIYKKAEKTSSKPKFKIGDTVRISKEKLLFEKGYEQNWTREIFTIREIIHRNPIVYRLEDLSGDLIKGTFYKEELQKISDSGYYPVEKVLRKRKRNGRTEYFVKFQGYPEKFNSWVYDVKFV